MEALVASRLKRRFCSAHPVPPQTHSPGNGELQSEPPSQQQLALETPKPEPGTHHESPPPQSHQYTHHTTAGRVPPWLLLVANSAGNAGQRSRTRGGGLPRAAACLLGKGRTEARGTESGLTNRIRTAGRGGAGDSVEAGEEEGELEGSRRRGGEEMRLLNGEGHFGNFGLGFSCWEARVGFLLLFSFQFSCPGCPCPVFTALSGLWPAVSAVLSMALNLSFTFVSIRRANPLA